MNTHHPNTKLKPTIHDKFIHFLDVTVFKGQNFVTKQKFDTKVFFKPTDTHELLHRTSYHPKHTFTAIVKSQIMRFHRICSNKNDFDEACTILFSALKHRGYKPRALRKIKSKFLQQLIPRGSSNKCGQPRCKTCPFISQNNIIKNMKKNIIPLSDNLTCKSERVVYAISCSNCNAIYVGQTRRKLHERFTEHRATIRNKKPCPVSDHFNKSCPNMDFIKITPLEHVELKQENTNSRTFEDGRVVHLPNVKDHILFLKSEQKWIKMLGSRQPYGMNKRRDLPPPIPFCLKFMDQSPRINNIVRNFYQNYQENNRSSGLHQLVCASKRNPNLKDILVQS